ncbi:autotransporter domain-containing protein [Arenimonas sp.]|uniref:autotransporter family protein n=1 Tax=Arenimonas sp. TaxID=1872635 RepID=UPI0039E5C8CA
MHAPNQAGPAGRWAILASRILRDTAVAALLACGLVAPAAAQATVSLEAVTENAGALAASADTPLSLSVMVKSEGNPVAGRTVRWKVTPDDGVLARSEGLSSAGGADMPELGTASNLFTAPGTGSYLVTASTQSNPGCAGENCATWSEVQFRIEVGAAAARTGVGSKLLPVAIGAGAAALLLSNNGGSDGIKSARRSLAKVSGDGQSGATGGPASLPLVVRADNDDRPASGEAITWTASGGATLSATSTSTDSSGLSQVSITNLGPGPGPVTVTARRTDSPDMVSFTVTVLNKTLVIVSGNGQSAPINTQVPAPLVVEARLGPSPQSGIGIIWNIVSGDATIDSVSNGGNTNGSGQSSAVIDLGPTPGPVVVSATRADAVAVTQTFVLNSLLIRTLDVVSGDNQTAAPNTPLPSPLVVHAEDNGANAAGVTINWMATGGATLSSPSSVTDAFGQASVTVTSTGPGPDPFTVTAVRADDPSAMAMFNGNVIPPVLTIVSGDGQTGLTGSAAEDPLEVLLVDGGGNPVSGQNITWMVTSGSATLASGSSSTDGAGHAFMTFDYGAFPGPITINASAYGGLQEVDFSATANTADALQKTSGDGQAANPGTVLAPFVVTIDPPAGATDLAGVEITFAVTSGTGTLSSTSEFTNASGQASTTLTLGLTPGTVTVLAQVVNGPSATFTATINGSLVATQLTIVSGDGQTLSTGQASAPMIVELKDGGTPLQGLTVHWSSNNGSLSAASSVTDSNGRASATVTPSSAGAVVVTADFDAYAQYTASSVSFNHNTTLASIPNLSTDQEAVAIALDNACIALSDESSPDSGEQDLLEQCEALADASESDPDAVADAIDELLPDVAQTQTQTGEAAVDAQFDNLNGRINTLRAGGTGASFGGLSITTATGTVSLGSLMTSLLGEDEAAKQEEAGFSRWGFFASGNIGRGETDANGNAPRYDFDVRGLTVGIDYRKTDNLVLGVAVGYTNQDTTLSGGQGSLDMSGWSLSGYATLYRENSWYVDGVLSWGHNDYSHRRRVVYTLPGLTVDQIARASSGGTDTSASVTLGRDFNAKAWNFGLYGRAQYSRQRFDSFTERLDANSPGAGLALRIDDRTVTSLSSVIGGKASYAHSTNWGVLMPMFGLEWQREYNGDPDAFRAFLVSDPTGTPILITGNALDNNYFRVNIGLSFVLTKGRSGFIQYDRIVAREGNSLENLTLGFRIEF